MRKKGREGGKEDGVRKGWREGRKKRGRIPPRMKKTIQEAKVATYYDFATLPKSKHPESPLPPPQTSTVQVVCVSEGEITYQNKKAFRFQSPVIQTLLFYILKEYVYSWSLRTT